MWRLIRLASAFFFALLVIMSLPGSATGSPESVKIAGWLAKAIEDRLHAEFEGPGRKLESVKVSIPEKFREPEDFDTVDIRIPYQSRMGGRVYVTTSFRKGQRVVSRVNAMATVKMSMDVIVAGREIKRGTIISAEDLKIENREVGPGFQVWMTDISEVAGKQADRNIRAGLALRKSFVSRPKLVRSGDMVSVTAISGSLTITTRGKAKQDGDRDEWIRVVNTQSKKTITARVVGPGEVMVEF